jgi:hypothetical protein
MVSGVQESVDDELRSYPPTLESIRALLEMIEVLKE